MMEQLAFDLGDGYAPDPARYDRVEPIAAGRGRIAVGTCGFSYRDWIGPFYPAKLSPREMLPYYAQHFSIVEIDASYYAVPKPAVLAGMAGRTPADFRFAVKAPGTVTHLPLERDLHADVAAFRESLQPLLDAGKLTVALLQFPNAFRPAPAAYEYLQRLRDAWPDVPLAVEFRRRDWQNEATLELLETLGVAWTNVDEPQFETLMRPSSDAVGELAYVRFHGRNAAQWWQPAHPEDRYDYRYSEAELVPWIERVAEMSFKVRQTLSFFNNHRLAHAVADARTFAAMLRGRFGSPESG